MGLGNPLARYTHTRHNIGHRVLDEAKKEFSGEKGVLWIKTTVYMNASGMEIRKILDKYAVTVRELLVVCDDAQLRLGDIRIRPSGSSGGQNGLQSVIEVLGTEDFARLRVGVGPLPEHAEITEFVLSEFNAEENEAVRASARKSAEAAMHWARHGCEAAMNRFNERSTI